MLVELFVVMNPTLAIELDEAVLMKCLLVNLYGIAAVCTTAH